MYAASYLVTLPQEVWENVARHLTVREWAALSGASKTHFRVQLELVRFDEGVCCEGACPSSSSVKVLDRSGKDHITGSSDQQEPNVSRLCKSLLRGMSIEYTFFF